MAVVFWIYVCYDIDNVVLNIITKRGPQMVNADALLTRAKFPLDSSDIKSIKQ